MNQIQNASQAYDYVSSSSVELAEPCIHMREDHDDDITAKARECYMNGMSKGRFLKYMDTLVMDAFRFALYCSQKPSLPGEIFCAREYVVDSCRQVLDVFAVAPKEDDDKEQPRIVSHGEISAYGLNGPSKHFPSKN